MEEPLFFFFTTQEITHLLLAETISETAEFLLKTTSFSPENLEEIWPSLDKSKLRKGWLEKLKRHSVPLHCALFIDSNTDQLKEYRQAFSTMLRHYSIYYHNHGRYSLSRITVRFFSTLQRPSPPEFRWRGGIWRDLDIRACARIERKLKEYFEEGRHENNSNVLANEAAGEFTISDADFFQGNKDRYWEMEMFKGHIFKLTL